MWYEDAAKVKQGVHITWYSAEDRAADLKASMGCYRDGQRHGLWLFWHSTGPTSALRSTGILREEIHYANGKKHGPYARYSASGQPMQIGEYQDDKTSGHWKQYSSGVLTAEGRLDESLNRQGIWHFYDSRGYLTRVSSHVDHLQHGKSVVYRTFTEAGETRVGMSAVEYFVAGVKHGPYVAYVPQTGQVASEGEYFEGKEYGAWRYYSSGVLTHTGQWHHGKRAGTWIYYRPDGSELRREELGTP